MIIGSHVSFGGKGLLGSATEAVSYGANTFMCYTGAPQNTLRKPIDEESVRKAHEYMQENGINPENIICHAPYIINLANKSKPEAWEFSVSFLKQELKRCEALGIKYIVLHPGSAVSHTKEEALENICDALNDIINVDTKVMILLETMAGKGTECGRNVEEIKNILDNIIFKDKIGVCLDTCHLHDSGIDLTTFDEYLEKFHELIGIHKIKCIHINDSLNQLGSHKDRHANLGYGKIGFNNLLSVIYNEKLKDVPKILETPYINNYPPYKFEIEAIKNKEFDDNLFKRVEDYYKNL
ncbi:MAG: deoxyribonuclease IV [Firmicutes bacterium]|nr:deoxyribonuclease IV [Bacillota bacterium]